MWQRVRSPFKYPRCVKGCEWEIYDVVHAGCLKCGSQHQCQNNAFEGNCPLVETENGARVCTITGFIIPDVRYAKEEYIDHAVMESGEYREKNIHMDLDNEIKIHLDKILSGPVFEQCRVTENSHQSKKIYKSVLRQIRMFKMEHPNTIPNFCKLLSRVLHMEKRISFIHPASGELKRRCHEKIYVCVLDLHRKGYRVSHGNRLQDLVCGLLYLLRTGIQYRNHELFACIPEIARCIPMESRLKAYFNINSKVITSVENEVKLAFRDFHQITG